MNSNQNFALEQLEDRIEMHCGWHWTWCRVCLVKIPFVGCIYVWRPCLRWYCN